MNPRLTRAEVYASKLADELAAHDRLDTERFAAVTATLEKIDKNVESLMATRSFTRGVWRAAVVAATVVSTLATVAIEVIKWKAHP